MVVSADAFMAGDAASAIIAADDGAACMSSKKDAYFLEYCPAWWVAMERAGSYASGEKAPKVGADGAGVLRRGDRLGDRSRASH